MSRLLLLPILLLAACGQAGDLYLPEPPPASPEAVAPPAPTQPAAPPAPQDKKKE